MLFVVLSSPASLVARVPGIHLQGGGEGRLSRLVPAPAQRHQGHLRPRVARLVRPPLCFRAALCPVASPSRLCTALSSRCPAPRNELRVCWGIHSRVNPTIPTRAPFVFFFSRAGSTAGSTSTPRTTSSPACRATGACRASARACCLPPCMPRVAEESSIRTLEKAVTKAAAYT